MEISHHHHHRNLSSFSSSSSSSPNSPSMFNNLYCAEHDQQWEEDESAGLTANQSLSLLPILMLQQDLFCQDEDLQSLFSKEADQELLCFSVPDSVFSSARRVAVDWMLKVNSFFNFSTLTSILSINYLDRFISKSPNLPNKNKPWTIHLAAVACISLAAKFEEVHIPLLLDLQVEGAEYLFEPKSIQKMELMILSTLDWKMNPVTPVSFLDHIIRRLGLKNHLQFELLRRCEQLLLSFIADSRFHSYLPSVLATATMLVAIHQIQPSNPLDYHHHLISILNINKEKVRHCYELLVEVASKNSSDKRGRDLNNEIPSSPNGVIDSYYFGLDSSSDSWAVGSSNSSSVSSSPDQRAMKRIKRVHEQYMPLRVIFNAIGSP